MKGSEIKIRISDEEKAEWQRRAADSGLKLSEWVRRQANRDVTLPSAEEMLQYRGVEAPNPIAIRESAVESDLESVGSVHGGFKDTIEVLGKPSPPRPVAKKGKLCQSCTRKGRPSCDACRKANAKSALDAFDVEAMEDK